LLAKETLKPNEGKKDYPAHPAIYPTGNLPDQTFSAGEKRLWELARANTSFPLPQKGTLGSHNKKCAVCGWPTIEFRRESIHGF